jgi:poly-gamma-glutamate synthesis protein (capsule biosynthesis protein)
MNQTPKRRRRFTLDPKMFLVILIATAATFLTIQLTSHHASAPESQEPVAEEPEVETASFDLIAVGDMLIHEGIYRDAKKLDGSYDFKPMFENVKPIISSYDLAYYNQETILGGTALGLSGYPMFNSPQEVGDAAIDTGFDLVSLATNHTLDKGEAGVLNSVEYWNRQPIIASGQWASQESRNEVKTYEKNGITYAFFSYTIPTNGLTPPAGKDYLTNIYSREKAKQDIDKIKNKVDLIIVAMHWGTEYVLGDITTEQEQEANYLSSLGVQLIIGAHPHVIEPVTYIENNDTKTFVIYSLGNFISDQEGLMKNIGLATALTVEKTVTPKELVVDSTVALKNTTTNEDGSTTTIEIKNPSAELVYTAAARPAGAWDHDFKLYFESQLTDSTLPNSRAIIDEYHTYVNSLYPELIWGVTEKGNQ